MTMRLVSLTFMVVATIFLIVAIGIIIGITTYQVQAERVSLGLAEQFPPGSVTALQLPAAFYDPMYRFDGQQPPVPIGRVAPIPIFLVHDPNRGFIALYNRDTHSTCRIRWIEYSQVFEDLCHGAQYTRTGEYRGGPAPRGLDRFAVEITVAGEVVVNVGVYQKGPPGPVGAVRSFQAVDVESMPQTKRLGIGTISCSWSA
jgi:hypothetical protein